MPRSLIAGFKCPLVKGRDYCAKTRARPRGSGPSCLSSARPARNRSFSLSSSCVLSCLPQRERARIFHSLSLPLPPICSTLETRLASKLFYHPSDRPTDRNMWGHFLPVKWGMKARRMGMPKWRLCYQVLTLFCTNDGTDKDPHPNEIAGVFLIPLSAAGRPTEW